MSTSKAQKNGDQPVEINESEFKIEGELIAQGSEAKVFKSKYENKQTIVKYRFPKKYRHPLLDLKLRRNRSKKEQKCIRKAKEAGIRVPELYYMDKKNCAIHMEYLNVPTVKRVLIKYFDEKTKKYDSSKCTKILEEIGRNIAILHKNDIVHGDLTTSNLLIDEEKDQIIMIDFGLSEGSTKAEDKAVDIYVLERALLSTHPESEHMIAIILDEYKKHYTDGQERVLKRLDAVRLRGRKRSMIG